MRHVPVAMVLCGVVAILLAGMCGQVAATPTPPPPPLVCRTAEDSAVLVQTACRLDDACRFYFPRGVPVVLLEQRLHIVQARASGGGAAATDVRTFYQPAAWNDGTPLIAYAAAAEDVGASNCTALAAALNETVPPPAVRDALYALLVYQTLLADDRICTDVNEIPVWDDASQAYYCACAAGHVCASSTALGGGLTYAAVVLFAVVVMLGALAVTVASACATRQVLVRLREDAIKRARLRMPVSV